MSSGDGMVHLTIDGQAVAVPPTKTAYDPQYKKTVEIPTTIYDAALALSERTGKPNPIPILCHREHVNPVAVCRVCVVEDRPGGKLTPACHRAVEEGMAVKTAETSPRVKNCIKILTELLLTDQPADAATKAGGNDNELLQIAKRYGVTGARFPKPAKDRGRDESSLVIAVDHNACIMCDRCIRGCNEIRDNQVLGRMGKGYNAHIAFDLNNPMGESSCVACGECMISCPTGALTFRAPVQAEPWKGATPPPQPVGPQDLANHPLFEGISPAFLKWNAGSVVRRHFKAGDVICREGDFGSTAFYIEKGKVDILVAAPIKHVKSKKGKGDKTTWGPFGLIRKFTSALAGRDEDRRDEEGTAQSFPVDAPVALDTARPYATLVAGDLFGEMTCMSHYPRAATVRAAEDVTVLELLRNVLYILQRSKKSRAVLEAKYRERAVASHLRGVRVFAELLQEPAEFARFVDFLRFRVELERRNPGDIIFRQGDPADDFFMVRIGFVKVTQQRPGGEHVLNYIGPGGYFGEIGLMGHLPEVEEALGEEPIGVRTATCSALDHVDLVRVKGNDFRTILTEFPKVRGQLIRVAVEHLKANAEAMRQAKSVPLGSFLRQGLMNAQSLLVLDLEKCTRCDECTKACADAHDGVTRLIRDGLRFDKYLVASSCRSCLDPYCMVGCPVGSIRRRHSREIIIEDWCIGCGKCAENCPYGNINMHPFPTGETVTDPETGARKAVVQQKATLCDLCTDLDGHPSCVYACPHDAAHRMTGPQLLRAVEKEHDG
jgi:CRP-like cAMP-binding protein/Fe-S-cluster-containing hydrogenase component 2